jgi:hypoxanthine phosphoribosyltransferase
MGPDAEVRDTLYSEEQIRERVRELAGEINSDYKGRNPLLVGILKGAFVFLSDLAREIDLQMEFDFMAVSSYGSSSRTSGVVRILKDLDTDIQGRDLLVVEDIIDTGLTLNYLIKNLKARGPASLEICALLNKEIANKVRLPVRYVGFTIPDVFVVGYGLDYSERFRNLPYIARLGDDC